MDQILVVFVNGSWWLSFSFRCPFLVPVRMDVAVVVFLTLENNVLLERVLSSVEP